MFFPVNTSAGTCLTSCTVSYPKKYIAVFIFSLSLTFKNKSVILGIFNRIFFHKNPVKGMNIQQGSSEIVFILLQSVVLIIVVVVVVVVVVVESS